MGAIKKSELLNDPLVRAEIERHCWIESEKKRGDIGIEHATKDWLQRFGHTWHRSDVTKPVAAGRVAKCHSDERGSPQGRFGFHE